jgi:hypothetical protein
MRPGAVARIVTYVPVATSHTVAHIPLSNNKIS